MQNVKYFCINLIVSLNIVNELKLYFFTKKSSDVLKNRLIVKKYAILTRM